MPDPAHLVHDGVEVLSASETPDQLKAALGVATEPQTPPAEVAEPEPTESTEGDVAEAPADTEAGKQLQKKRKSLQDRIDAITREKYQTARERDEARMHARRLEQELADLRKAPAPPAPAPTIPLSAEHFPKYADYLTTHPDAEFEDWLEARDTWRDAKRDEQTRTRTAEDTRQRQYAERTQNFTAKMQQATTADPSLLERIDPRLLQTKALSALAPHEPPTFGNFLVEQVLVSEYPDKLLLHLSNDQEVQRLATLAPDRVIRELAKIEYGFSAGNGTAPRGPAPVASPQSTAKPPIKPLGATPPVEPDAPPGDQESDEAHLRYWNAKELARRRR